ncbi:iron complex transport system substrate-binding protein [Sinosporangium album]|uniref:Iron complex transport system substrate-binding protein n=1 Tax=Sinosporangium album TaxID=504805 RepID=A0A1G7ZRF0_9ACTN|nr:iron-siderophore ABC transporter substrate-binding protein [Sinosporangium album]SDH10690.1 iron complex transport system substrate-binding protein [Sinosporangium album]
MLRQDMRVKVGGARWLPALVAAAALLVGGAACGGDTGGGAEGKAPPSAGSAAFPVTIKHAAGETVIERAPKRVVALSTGWVDATLALGVVPVAGNKWSASGAVFAPWNPELKEPATTAINTVADISVEQIAGLRPDVIFGSYQVTSNKGLYTALSEIAPTIGIIGTDNQDGTWQEILATVGKVLGKSAEAQKAVEEGERRLAGVATTYPGLKGKTVSYVVLRQPGTVQAGARPNDHLVRFFQSMGLGAAPGLVKLESKGGETGFLSYEQLNALDGDLMFIGGFSDSEMAGFEKSELFKKIPTVKNGTYHVLDAEKIGAMRTPTVRNISYLLDAMRPALEKAGS